MRDNVRALLLWIAAAAVTCLIVLVLTAVVRIGLRAAFLLIVEALPVALRALWYDPLLILALIIAAIIVWAKPWDNEGFGGPRPPVRRGRNVVSLHKARQQARSRLSDRKAVPRRPHRPFGGVSDP